MPKQETADRSAGGRTAVEASVTTQPWWLTEALPQPEQQP